MENWKARGEARNLLNGFYCLYIILVHDTMNTQPHKELHMKHNFQIRMDKKLFDRVKALAEQEHRSISAQIQAMLKADLDKRENKK